MIRRARCIPGKEQDVSGALMEALANAVIHGNRQRPEKMVHIRVRYEPHKCLSIAVRDEGAGFDPTAVPDPTCPDNLACDHGRGILMMRAFMDEVHFEKNGTECHLTKKCDNPVTATIKDYASRAADFLHSHVHHHHRS
jgi:serine/threonine-protein kinase RsbW